MSWNYFLLGVVAGAVLIFLLGNVLITINVIRNMLHPQGLDKDE